MQPEIRRDGLERVNGFASHRAGRHRCSHRAKRASSSHQRGTRDGVLHDASGDARGARHNIWPRSLRRTASAFIATCMVKSVSITDAHYRAMVGGAGLALVVAITTLRFCGGIALPAKSPPPVDPRGTSSQLLTRSSATPALYLDFIARDAQAAGVPVPSVEALSRKLAYQDERARHVLEVGQPAIAAAGVRLRAVHVDTAIALEIENASERDLAYAVESAILRNGVAVVCNTAPLLPFNAMTIARGGRETRAECTWRTGIAILVTRVETIEVPPLSVWYLNHVPPSAVGIAPRIARAHTIAAPPTGSSSAASSAASLKLDKLNERCGFAIPQSVRSGLERGEIGWRDLVDFYARHRCQTYQFPPSYRAFTIDSERPVPAVSAGM